MRLFLLFCVSFLLSCGSKTQFHSFKSQSDAFLSANKASTSYNESTGGLNPSSNKAFPWFREDFTLEAEKSLVDILIIADTSRSMSHRLSELGHSLSDLLSVIHDYDWQIGITSADHGDHKNPKSMQESWKDNIQKPHGRFGGLMNLENERRILKAKILTNKTPNYENVFLHSLSHHPERSCNRPPFCHPRLEQPLRALKSAMERASLDNKSFFRPQADFVSLIISNEEERAEDKKRATKARHVLKSFDKTFSHLDKKFIAFNIIILDEDCLRKEKSNSPVAQKAPFIAELATMTGGYNISICSKDYGRVLRQLSEYIKNSLENSILLEKEPLPDSLYVEFTRGPELKWQQFGRNIIFENQEAESISVSVSYQSPD